MKLIGTLALCTSLVVYCDAFRSPYEPRKDLSSSDNLKAAKQFIPNFISQQNEQVFSYHWRRRFIEMATNMVTSRKRMMQDHIKILRLQWSECKSAIDKVERDYNDGEKKCVQNFLGPDYKPPLSELENEITIRFQIDEHVSNICKLMEDSDREEDKIENCQTKVMKMMNDKFQPLSALLHLKALDVVLVLDVCMGNVYTKYLDSTLSETSLGCDDVSQDLEQTSVTDMSPEVTTVPTKAADVTADVTGDQISNHPTTTKTYSNKRWLNLGPARFPTGV